MRHLLYEFRPTTALNAIYRPDFPLYRTKRSHPNSGGLDNAKATLLAPAHTRPSSMT